MKIIIYLKLLDNNKHSNQICLYLKLTFEKNCIIVLCVEQ